MPEGEDTYQAFFGLKLGDDKKDWTHFSYSTDLEKLKSWAAAASKPADSGPPEVSGSSEISTRSALASMMGRVVDSGLALSELIISSGTIRPLFSDIVSRVEVVNPVKDRSPVVFEDESIRIYGISADRLGKIREQHRRLLRMDRGFDLLPSAVLLTVVATFNSLSAEIVRQMLTLKPDRFHASDKTLAVQDILSMSSFDDVKTRIIDDEVYQFSRGSHDDQVKAIERWFNVKIAENWKRWPDFIEIFERRNLIAHGEKAYTQRYVTICKSHGHKGSEKLLGEMIELTESYLSQSLDVLMEFGILLVFSIWRKQIPSEENSAFEDVNEVCYRLINDDRYRVPVRVLEYVLSLKGTNVSQAAKLMLTVNLASGLRHLGTHEKSLEVLNGVDWTAASDNYRICVAALRDDVDSVVALMQIVSNAGTVTKESFREWPVFSFVRTNEKFQQKFTELFEQPLFDPEIEETKIEMDQGLDRASDDDSTLH